MTPGGRYHLIFEAGPAEGIAFMFSLRTLGINGEGIEALHAVAGYDDATGIGSPRQYIQFVQIHG